MSRFPLIQPWAAPIAAGHASIRALIGVDGGGTGTRVRLSDLHGQLLGQGQAGPSALGQGVAQAWQHIQQAVQQALAQAGLESLSLSQLGIGLGLSGAGVPDQARDFMALNPGYALVCLENDGFTSVLGAHGGAPGGVLAAGTGTVGEALRSDGSRALVSGWGWVSGDEGSGAWLGLQAMRLAQKALDGRLPAGPLARAVWAHCGAVSAQGQGSVQALAAWVAQAGQHAYAQMAPLVLDHQTQDPAAAGLVELAVQELEAVIRALDPQSTLPLSFTGSVAQRLASQFSAGVRARCVAPQGDSAHGALLLVRSALSENC
ncbi:BadF/BadG/BcrA/BcrD ATPase family protein [Roseateles sp. BYS180W]|uniref:BadF/BadG/BcrA/BcrD ATPase family protein n=1 Tax=Roseateles rivi TaxID=3299028 RepID=A0ABW7FWC8_9BURK